MFQYIIKRILIFIPTLFIISLLAFGLSKVAPGDPVEIRLGGGQSAGQGGQQADLIAGDKAYQEMAEKLGMHLPTFYFSLSSQAFPDTIFSYTKRAERQTLTKIINQYGNWSKIEEYYNLIKKTRLDLAGVPDSLYSKSTKIKVSNTLAEMLINNDDSKLTALLNKMDKRVAKDTLVTEAVTGKLTALRTSYEAMKASPTPSQLSIPSFKWYGFNNQYHNWISSFLVGDFGESYSDGMPVWDKMTSAVKWTFIMNFFAILIAYLLSIPIGVASAVKKDTRFDRIMTVILFIFYSLPTFWIATLLVVFLTTPDYGSWTDLFPTEGLGDLPYDAPFLQRFGETAYHLILPIFCLTYGSLAFISRQMRGGMLSVIRQDYIRTARAKGLDENTIIWKHAFRNSLFPIITLFASVFPAALAGSVVIEVIFNIPGMGGLAYGAIIGRDWPIVFTVLMLAAILTMIGNLVADMLYAVADPRVTYTSKA